MTVCSSSRDFLHYHSGILNSDNCGTCGDHTIIMTGIYDMEGEEPYYIV